MTDNTPFDTPIHNAQELHERWQGLMRPLGFSRRYLYFALIDRDRRMVPQLHEVSDFPIEAHPQGAAQLMEIFRHLTSPEDPEFSIALLIARPGRGPMDAADRAWARELVAAAGRARVPLEPIHLATDATLVPFAGDDLAA